MDRETYETALHDLLNDGHEFIRKLHALTDQIGDAGTAEWNLGYQASRSAGVAVEFIYRQLYPLPSTFNVVPMVCTACRKPVKRCPNDGYQNPQHWRHVYGPDATACPDIRGDGTEVEAMVAAGNERTLVQVWDEAKPAMSARLTDA